MSRVWPAMFGAAGGAYALNEIHNTGMSDIVRGFAGRLGVPTSTTPSTPAAGGGEGLTALQREVERLQTLLTDVARGQRNAGPHIIYRDSRSNGWLVVAVPLIVGVGYVYCRLRGWQIGDFMYVTRGSLTTLKSTVTDNFTRIWDYMGKQKEEFVSRFVAIGVQQDRLIEAQGHMDQRLKDVGEDVTGIASTTTRIGEQVGQLDERMLAVDSGVQYANQGITLLCQAMADVTHRLNFNARSAEALRSYAQATPMLQASGGPYSQGLRGLLGSGVSLSIMSAEGTAGAVPSAASPVPAHMAAHTRLPAAFVTTLPSHPSEAVIGSCSGGPPHFDPAEFRVRSVTGPSVLFDRNLSEHSLPRRPAARDAAPVGVA